MVEVKLPRTSEDNDESLIVLWYVQEGDRVEEGDPLVEIQTDKAVFEIEAEENGVIQEIVVKRGESAKVGETLALIATKEIASDTSSESGPSVQGKKASNAREARKERPFVRVSPRLRRLARELGVDLAAVQGTGQNGAITEDDIREAASDTDDEPASLPSIPVKGIRRTIAERMVASLHESAQLTETTWADVTALARKREDLQPKMTWNDVVSFAAVASLKEHPMLNRHIKGDRLIPFDTVHLGIAVHTEAGLLVPVIKHADRLTLAELHTVAARLTEKAKAKKLSPEDMSGSTFTVTNLGKYGIQFFTPILNPPEVAILGVGEVESYAAFDGDRVVRRERLPLSLTFDHRALDGVPAAQYLQTLVHTLEHPNVLLSE